MPLWPVCCRAGFLRRVLSIAVVSVVLWPATSDAQAVATSVVRGRVLADDGTPLSGALVEMTGKKDSARTLPTGEFLFQAVPAGPEVLRIRALGYGQKYVSIRVSADSGWTGTIVIARVPQSLPDVQVTAPGKPPEFADITKYDDFFRRRRLGFGTFRTRHDIERMGAADIVSTLQGIPGVNVAMTSNPYGAPELRFRMARCPGQPPNIGIYLNGTRVALFAPKSENKGSELSGAFRKAEPTSTCDDCVRMGEVLSSLPIHEVMFIEFYRGPGQIPNDLDRGDSCAALVIWTR